MFLLIRKNLVSYEILIFIKKQILQYLIGRKFICIVVVVVFVFRVVIRFVIVFVVDLGGRIVFLIVGYGLRQVDSLFRGLGVEIFGLYFFIKYYIVVYINEFFGQFWDSMNVGFYGRRIESRKVGFVWENFLLIYN